MKFVALKELPQGQQPGDVFDAHEDVGAVFISVGAARVATEDDLKPRTGRSGRYRRRDLQAQD